MQLIDRAYVEQNKQEIIDAILHGKIFIYPTDTIYGIGANAGLDDAIRKIREIKQRPEKPFSLIAPSKSWIEEDFIIPENLILELNKLPGPYTLILKLNEKSEAHISPSINPGLDTIGVRIPDHWFSKTVEESGVPFVTTSVNLAGEKHMESIEDVPQNILNAVDYVIYEGPKRGESSIKIDLT